MDSSSLTPVAADTRTHAPTSGLSSAQVRVLDALDEGRLLEDLVALVRVPSVTGADAESDLQAQLAAEFSSLGLDVDHWELDLDALRADPEHPGTESERSQGWGLVGTSAGEGEVALILQGHSDVVPTGDLSLWGGGGPFSGEVIGDVLHGRGACDMKAGVAVNLAVARALRDSGVSLERRFALHQVISEEDGGLGAFATLRRGHTGEVAVITEPTSGHLVVANAGALTFTLHVEGRAAHGSTRLEGVSAFEAFWPIHLALRAFESRRNADRDPLFADNPLPYGISVGRIQSGDWSSSVPDALTAEGRYGVRLGEDVADARRDFEEAVAEACAADPWLREHPARVEWTGGQFASGQTEVGHPLIAEVSDAIARTTGRVPEHRAAPYGSDLRLYAGIGGIPTLHYGPGDVRMAHAPREQVSIPETIEVARALALLAATRLGAHL